MKKQQKRSPARETWIMGKNCIREVLRAYPERIIALYTAREEDPLILEAKKKSIELKIVGRDRLNKLVLSESHQGFVAQIRNREYVDPKEFLSIDREDSMVLMSDGIEDPMNFGAMLRAAEAFGVDVVVFSKNRSVEITAVVSKTSVGGSELVPLMRVSNLAETMKLFQKAGYFAIATDVNGSAENVGSFSFPRKSLIIMGSEAKGVQPLLVKKADSSVYIPMRGRIDSLNVSQATSIFLHQASLSRLDVESRV